MMKTPLPKIFFQNVHNYKSEAMNSFLCESPFHTIHLMLPRVIQHNDSVLQILDSETNQYVMTRKIPLTCLLEETFINSFVKKGHLWVQTIEADGNFDNFVSIRPPGTVLLSVTRRFYQKLGIHGNLCSTHQQGDKYEISIDLTSPLCQPGKKDYDKMYDKLQKNELFFNLILKWIPTEPLVCSSSVQDYFQSKGFDCRLCESRCLFSEMRSAPLPKLDFCKPLDNNLESCSAEEALEWIGAQVCGLQWDEESLGNVVFPSPANPASFYYGQWRSMFAPDIVHDLLPKISEILEGSSIPYAVVFAHRFQDSWKENMKFNCDKMSCIVLFPKSRCWLFKN